MTQQALCRQKGNFYEIMHDLAQTEQLAELVQTALTAPGHEIRQGRTEVGRFCKSRWKSSESIRQLLSSRRFVLTPWPLRQAKVVFAPLSQLTAENWRFSLGSKLMGQISLVEEAIPFINEKGSFTLISGVLNDEPIFASAAAAGISGALEGFARAAAIELPKGLRMNVVTSYDPEEIRSSIWSVLSRRNYGRRLESGTGLQTRDSGGANRTRLQSRLSLSSLYSNTRAATSQEPMLAKKST